MASFLCAIIASRDNSTFVLNALQLVELLAIKLPDVYQISFLREGVVFEIEALAAAELSTMKAANAEAATETVKKEPEEPTTPVACPSLDKDPAPTADEAKPVPPASVIPSGLSSLLAESAQGVSLSPRRSSSQIDPADANIIRARVLLAKKLFEFSGDHKNVASMVLDKLGTIVKRLCLPEASEAELRDSVRDIGSQFINEGAALSSFELLKSGLVDGLLDFVDIDGTVSSNERRAMLFEMFCEYSHSSPTPLTMLVKRLHEALGRLENFEVETAFNGMSDSMRPSASSLSRTMRIRLQAEEGQNIPRQASALGITIQAIAPMQALHDYLRPRVADGSFGSSLSSMFAAYASGMQIPRGASNTASRIFAAMAGPGDGPSTSGAGASTAIASSAPENSSMPPPRNEEPTGQSAKPLRRRSARLSGQGVSETVSGPAAGSPSGPVLSSSAPEPSILPSMPIDMDFDEDEYSDEDYDAEVRSLYCFSQVGR